MEISANYLSGKVMQTAGLPLSPYQQYLEEFRQEIPVISAEETRYTDESVSGEDTLLSYQKLQYYMLFQ